MATSSQSVYEEFKNIWSSTHLGEIEEEVYKEKSKILGQLAELNQQVISVFNTNTSRIIYLSGDFLKIIGYPKTEKEYCEEPALYWMKNLPLEQSWFFLKMGWFFKKTVRKILSNNPERASLNWYIHNFRLKDFEGKIRYLNIINQALKITASGDLVIILAIIKNNAPLIKNKSTWWAEFCINGQNKYNYHCKSGKFQKGGIFSEREKEVLALIEAGQASAEIADKLQLSLHTVEKHRKNLIERTGLKDSSALIQLYNELKY
jgi:DNA-binding CsgD family transcriptional regulator